MKNGIWQIGIVSKTKNGYKYDVSVELLNKLVGGALDG